MAEENIKTQAKKAVVWSTINSVTNQGLQFAIGIILARLLSPEDYGVIALPTIFLAIAQCFIDSGFSSALVRKTDLKEEDLSTAFYFNIVVGVFFYTVLFFCSPLIADFYNTPILKDVLRVTALSTLFGPLQSVHFAQFSRNMDFKTPAKISIACKFTTGMVGIGLAYLGWGIWALVFQGVAGQLLSLGMVWFISPWRPKTGWSQESFKYLFGFGSKLLGSSIIDTLYNNIIPVFMGKWCSARDLGLYNRGYGYAALPHSQINGIIGPLTFPIFSKLQNDPQKLYNYYQKIIRIVITILAPINLLLVVIAEPLVTVLITDKWADCIIILQLMATAIILWPIQGISISLYGAIGRSDIVLKTNIGVKLLGIGTVLASLPYGVVALCATSILRSFICILWVIYISCKLIELKISTFIFDISKPIIIAATMALSTYCTISFFDSALIKILIGVVMGISLYIIMTRCFNPQGFSETITILKNKRHDI